MDTRSDLFPTKTRLALLQDVAAARIRRITPDEGAAFALDLDDHVVTARALELEHAGWIELELELDPDDVEETFDFQIQHYRLTAAGEKVLTDG